MIRNILIWIFGIAAISIRSCSKQNLSGDCGSKITAAQAIDQAEAEENAQSALEALRDGDPRGASTVLEAQLRGSMLILHSTQPRLATNKDLTQQQRQVISQAIADGDSFLGQKK